MGLGNALTDAVKDVMNYNDELWNERHKETCGRISALETGHKDIRIFLFGNGKAERSVDWQVRENTKFREEMESMIRAIQHDVMKKVAWAVLTMTVLLIGGFGSVIALILKVTSEVPK